MSTSWFTSSWDDGTPTDIKLSRLLDKHGLTGTFFATTGPGGRRTIDDAGLAELAAHHEVGIHGRSHITFPQLSSDAIRHEIQWSAAQLAGFGPPSRVVAPPKGKLDRRVLKVVADLGYACRNSALVAGIGSHAGGSLMSPSFMFYPHRPMALVRSYGSRRAVPSIPLLAAWIGGGDFRGRMMSLMDSSLEHYGWVHLWGHSADVERLGAWDLLDEIFSHAAALGVTPVTSSELWAVLQSGAGRHLGARAQPSPPAHPAHQGRTGASA